MVCCNGADVTPPGSARVVAHGDRTGASPAPHAAAYNRVSTVDACSVLTCRILGPCCRAHNVGPALCARRGIAEHVRCARLHGRNIRCSDAYRRCVALECASVRGVDARERMPAGKTRTVCPLPGPGQLQHKLSCAPTNSPRDATRSTNASRDARAAFCAAPLHNDGTSAGCGGSRGRRWRRRRRRRPARGERGGAAGDE
jgi:hypothetical protein